MLARPDLLLVTLTFDEMRHGAAVGCERNISSLERGAKHRWNCPQDTDFWRQDIEGACGELAAAKALGVPWCGEFIREYDIGGVDACGEWHPYYQVRTNTSRTHDDLILHPEDKDADVFIAVGGRAPHFELRGFILGATGKQECWWREGQKDRFAYFYPRERFLPMADLPR